MATMTAPNKSPELCLGIDIGGSSIKAGIVTAEGNLLSKKQISHARFADTSNLREELGTLAGECDLPLSLVSRIGVAVPAAITENIPREGINVKMDFEKTFADLLCLLPQAKLSCLNDANAAALGEGWVGAAQEKDSYVLITLGTGIGCGIVGNGRLLEGCYGAAGELGHICIEIDGRLCNCGGKGCLEQYASAHGLVRAYEECRGAPEEMHITPRDVFEKGKRGDESAIRAFNAFGRYLGTGLASVVRMLDPGFILLGGGISKAYDLFEDSMRSAFRSCIPYEPYPTAIQVATLGNDAGIIGAARYALNQTDCRRYIRR